MPFAQNTGMHPDLIINLHAFPSRMTIAMLLESIASKGGSLHGRFVDATPFEDSLNKVDGDHGSESSSLVDELVSMLTARGFDKYGTETLYSGVYGTELTCEIFIGPVCYQRLRHMVSDKFQVRSTGTVDQVTRQPIKGRKRGGGIRFGEMERNAMLAHGAAYLFYCMTGCIKALIIMLLMCALFVEAFCPLQLSNHTSRWCKKSMDYLLQKLRKKFSAIFVRLAKGWKQLRCHMSSDF